ncbi:V-type ATP synthase subunit E, partial [Halorubrum distributum]
GGVVAESDTSRVRVNNTFDSVLESVWDDELKNISERLFDQ